MVEIKVKKGEPVERALRRLKRRVSREGIIKIIRDKRYYEKPSRKKYRKARNAKYATKMQSLREAYENGTYRPSKHEAKELT
jgi:small subunit ribosomal protein S21